MLLGELEQLVLLAVLQLDDTARAIDIRRLITEHTGGDVARGSIYAALQRLTDKGFLRWETETTTPSRGGIPRRRFEVTSNGVDALRTTRRAVSRLSEGLDSILAQP